MPIRDASGWSVAERLGTALVVTFEQRPRRERQVLRDLFNLISPGMLADQEVTSLASLITILRLSAGRQSAKNSARISRVSHALARS